MKISSIISLILPLVGVSLATGDFTFLSAMDFNICGKLGNINYGWGIVRMYTLAAVCLNDHTMAINCGYIVPNVPTLRPGFYHCGGEHLCLNVGGEDDLADAGCVFLGKPAGVKGDGDTDNYACSAGINVGAKPIWVTSAIYADNEKYQSGVDYCTVIKTSDKTHLTKGCEKKSKILKLAAHTAYQACIHTISALATANVAFHWHLGSTGKYPARRLHGRSLDGGQHSPGDGQHFSEDGQHFSEDGQHFSEDGQHFSEDGQHLSEDGQLLSEDGQPLSELFTIDHSAATSDAVKIVVKD
ncbi:hypothetical protein E2P81_ATG00877 [Venturia nashicola]|uniref:Uncharacterized protein n=1 Tax=Venturia nashicola TaxID=86259 RepID=A0A4Z1PC84_9PEZI|nr:hypothetical protein E6O75_ATG00893 [Venturia nashicola]TLD38334.1 hypothetical protein E2P81_ATG00877 [Venturia nashicola]